jgi:hypothetical protein
MKQIPFGSTVVVRGTFRDPRSIRHRSRCCCARAWMTTRLRSRSSSTARPPSWCAKASASSSSSGCRRRQAAGSIAGNAPVGPGVRCLGEGSFMVANSGF